MEQIDPTQPLPIDEVKESVDNRRPNGQFGAGNIANPYGRPPKGYSISDAFKRLLEADPDKKKEIVEKIYNAAINGDMTAAKMIWSYMDGQPAQAIDMTTLGEKMESKTIILTSKAKANITKALNE